MRQSAYDYEKLKNLKSVLQTRKGSKNTSGS